MSVFALAALSIVAGCGGSGLSHGAFVKRADAICSAYDSRVKLGIVTPRSYDAVERFVRQTLPLYEAALRKLEALTPPSRDAGAVHAWLANDRRVAAALRDLAVAAQRRDYQALNDADSRAQLAGNRSRAAAAGLGMHVCATLASPTTR
ncbi:MAG TPA: hypothetical protein VFA24_05200 [Gaiellaceae bacterium]|nr:hypothetical protein [Gaiellaceae bacterium]